MNLKEANNLIYFYKQKLRLQVSFLLSLCSYRFRERVIDAYKVENLRRFNVIFFIIRLVIMSLFCLILLNTIDSSKILMSVLISILFYTSIIYYIAISIKIQDNDHFTQLIGKRKFEFIHLQLTTTIKKMTIQKLLPSTIPIIILMIFQFKSYLILFLYLEGLLLFYLFRLMHHYIKLLLNHSQLKFSFFFDKAIKLVVSYLFFIFCLLLFFITFIISSYFESFRLNSILLVTIIYFIVLIIVFIYLNQIIFKQVSVKYNSRQNLKYDTKQITDKNEYRWIQQISPLLKLNQKQLAIMIKDIKLLIRSMRKELITYFLLILIPIYLGILLCSIFSDMNQITDTLLFMILMSDGIIFLTITILYLYQKVTWFSSEVENFEVFYKANISYYQIFKAKLSLNHLLTYIYLISFSLTTLFASLTNINTFVLWLFNTLYIINMNHLLTRTILYYDFIGPKANINFDYQTIRDKSNLFSYFFLLIFIIPVMVVLLLEPLKALKDIHIYYILSGILFLLMLMNMISIIKSKTNLKKIKRIAYGGIEYDNL